ncbi:MAG: hypothetical protein ABSG77_04025 [Candidatus Acidiferrum sp.]|jgi:hypothetical protein
MKKDGNTEITEGREIPRLRGPTRQTAARKRKSGRSARNDKQGKVRRGFGRRKEWWSFAGRKRQEKDNEEAQRALRFAERKKRGRKEEEKRKTRGRQEGR